MKTKFWEFLNESNDASQGTMNADKFRYLSLSIEHNHPIEHIEELLKGTGQYTAFELACEYGRIDVMDWVADYFYNKNPNTDITTSSKGKPFMIAIDHEQYKVIDWLLKYNSSLLYINNCYGFVLAAKNDNIKMVQYLVDFVRKYESEKLDKFADMFLPQQLMRMEKSHNISKKTMNNLDPLFRYFDDMGKKNIDNILPFLTKVSSQISRFPTWFYEEWSHFPEFNFYTKAFTKNEEYDWNAENSKIRKQIHEDLLKVDKRQMELSDLWKKYDSKSYWIFFRSVKNKQISSCSWYHVKISFFVKCWWTIRFNKNCTKKQ